VNPDSRSSAISGYSQLRNDLLQCIDDMLSLENIRGCPCEELQDKIQSNAFNLVVVGQFKRGKTSLINALLGADILPVAVVPLTSIVTIMTWGEALSVKVYFNDVRVAEIKPESLSDYVTEKGNPKNVKGVHEVVLTYPSPYLKDGVRLIDTPGVGSLYQHNTDVAYQYLPKSDAALFLLSVDQPMSKAELDFLKDVHEYSNKIFFILNKADYLRENELRESMEFSKNALHEAMGSEVKLFPISARIALDGSIAKSDEMVRKSLLPVFTDELHRFLMEEKGNVLILSLANNLLRMLSQAKLELGLELKSLTTPFEELQLKIRAFADKKREIEQVKSDFAILLEGETQQLAKGMLEDDLQRFIRELIPHEEAHLTEQFELSRDLPLKNLRSALEETVVNHVKQSFVTWRAIEDDRLAKAFEATCSRFITKINNTVDELLRFSSELFSVPFDTVKAEALWSMKSGFYYKFKEQPVGTAIIASTLTLALPKFIGDKIILKKMKQYLQKIVTMQAAGIGYDFEQRLGKSRLDFQWEMLQKIDATIEGISAAIGKGMTQRTKSEQEVEARNQSLARTAEKLDIITTRLIAIKAQVRGTHARN
jgi:GTP-binding protein EngB required for normal cell division